MKRLLLILCCLASLVGCSSDPASKLSDSPSGFHSPESSNTQNSPSTSGGSSTETNAPTLNATQRKYEKAIDGYVAPLKDAGIDPKSKKVDSIKSLYQ